MDDGEGEGEGEAELVKRPKKNPNVGFVPELAKACSPARLPQPQRSLQRRAAPPHTGGVGRTPRK